MARTLVCLAVGALLWAMLGAVQGAASWEVPAGSYVLALLATGGLLGLAWPGRSLWTGFLLGIPGAATLMTWSPHEQPDAFWWLVTTILGGAGAAGAHRLAVELRTHFAAPRRGR